MSDPGKGEKPALTSGTSQDSNAGDALDYAVDLGEVGPLFGAGYHIIVLRPGDKVPARPYATKPKLTWAQIEHFALQNHNFVVKLTEREPGVFQLVIDCDPRSYAALRRDPEFKRRYRQAQDMASVSLMSRAHERAFDPVDPADNVMIALLKFRSERVHRVLDGMAFDEEPEQSAMGLDPNVVALMDPEARAVLLAALHQYLQLQEAHQNAPAQITSR